MQSPGNSVCMCVCMCLSVCRFAQAGLTETNEGYAQETPAGFCWNKKPRCPYPQGPGTSRDKNPLLQSAMLGTSLQLHINALRKEKEKLSMPCYIIETQIASTSSQKHSMHTGGPKSKRQHSQTLMCFAVKENLGTFQFTLQENILCFLHLSLSQNMSHSCHGGDATALPFELGRW